MQYLGKLEQEPEQSTIISQQQQPICQELGSPSGKRHLYNARKNSHKITSTLVIIRQATAKNIRANKPIKSNTNTFVIVNFIYNILNNK
uniref:Uncharacterized protein n=1 Tax=viral metagenome TaxID=1070528 RepID=A0A6C0IRG4_9ZZZZ